MFAKLTGGEKHKSGWSTLAGLLLLPFPLWIMLINEPDRASFVAPVRERRGDNTMHIGFASKAAFMSGIGYTTKGVGLGIHAVGTGFVKTGEVLQGAGDTLTKFGEEKIATGKACWKASSCDCDPTKMTDEEILATGSVSKEDLAEIRTAQAQVKTEAKAETKKAEPAVETIEVSAEECAAALC